MGWHDGSKTGAPISLAASPLHLRRARGVDDDGLPRSTFIEAAVSACARSTSCSTTGATFASCL
jgi:hypothetical protein